MVEKSSSMSVIDNTEWSSVKFIDNTELSSVKVESNPLEEVGGIKLNYYLIFIHLLLFVYYCCYYYFIINFRKVLKKHTQRILIRNLRYKQHEVILTTK